MVKAGWLVSLLLVAMQLQAANLYKYLDENGTVVLDRSIPPEYVHKGYTILDEQGNVLKVVPPALTEAELVKQKEAERRAAMQEARDKELLKLYRSADDVDRAMGTWMNRLDVEISLIKNRLAIKRSELADLQSQAADLERVGKEVDQPLLDSMAVVQDEINLILSAIDDIEQRKAQDKLMFEEDRARVIELTDK